MFVWRLQETLGILQEMIWLGGRDSKPDTVVQGILAPFTSANTLCRMFFVTLRTT